MGGAGTAFTAGALGNLGSAAMSGSGVFSLPKAIADRCSPAARSVAMRANGGNERSEGAIRQALTWLQSHQNPDGSWGEDYKTSMTGLSVLAFMGHCERPGEGAFGESVGKGLTWLIDLGTSHKGKLFTASKGSLTAYEHAISAYALGEAHILTKDEKIVPVLTDAMQRIIAGQGEDGGWVYGYAKAQPSDTSVSGWAIQALKAAHLTGLNIPGVDESMAKAMNNIKRVQGSNGAFGYKKDAGEDARWGLVGVGILSLQIGMAEKGPPVQKAFQYMFSDEQGVPPKIEYNNKTANLYAWYYNTQAAFQAGGQWWPRWNNQCQLELLKSQSKDGSWPPVGEATAPPVEKFSYAGLGTKMDAQVYRTALCTLMLEVYYRYLATAR